MGGKGECVAWMIPRQGIHVRTWQEGKHIREGASPVDAEGEFARRHGGRCVVPGCGWRRECWCVDVGHARLADWKVGPFGKGKEGGTWFLWANAHGLGNAMPNQTLISCLSCFDLSVSSSCCLFPPPCFWYMYSSRLVLYVPAVHRPRLLSTSRVYLLTTCGVLCARFLFLSLCACSLWVLPPPSSHCCCCCCCCCPLLHGNLTWQTGSRAR